MDRQSAATGGMVGMQAVACGADQRRGQDRHEAGVAGCPDGLAAAAMSPVFFASLALEALAVVTCDTGGEADPLLSRSTPPPLATTL